MSGARRERLATLRAGRARFRPSRRQFELLVAEALDELPAEFRSRLVNVAVVVEEWPEPGLARRSTGGQADSLLGLYQGTPFGQRGTDYHLVPPDRITLYRRPILALCSTRDQVVQEIRDTVIHEVGHYFGLPEHELK